MSGAALTLEAMRRDIALALKLAPEAVDEAESLRDLGLDSLRTMDLVTLWEERLPGLDYIEFFEVETLGEWWQIVRRVQGG